MTQAKVIIVQLRRPYLNRADEMRSDPFWEFGSFGCTKCHQQNLMNPNKLDELKGARMAFAQGGVEGFRLVLLTPPTTLINHGGFGEAKWKPIKMPFKYEKAPLLIDNDGLTNFPKLKKFIKNTNRSTWLGKFSSRFRSRRTPVESELADEIVDIFQQKVGIAASNIFANNYEDALPYNPPKIDHNRKQTYSLLVKNKPLIRGCL